MTVERARITGPICMPDGSAAPDGVVIRFRLQDWDSTDDAVLLPGEVAAVVADGEIDVLLHETSTGNRQVTYAVGFTYRNEAEKREIKGDLGVIALDGAGPFDLADLLGLPVVEPVAADVLAQVVAAAAGSADNAEAAAASASAAAVDAAAAGVSATAAGASASAAAGSATSAGASATAAAAAASAAAADATDAQTAAAEAVTAAATFAPYTRVIQYVDSVNGSDANDGLTMATAKRTLGALTKGSYRTYRLLAGSVWRESFELAAYNGVVVEGWGDFTTGIPMIRGDEPMGAVWQDAATRGDAYTAVYSQSWAHSITIGAKKIPPWVFEDGKMMQGAASLAACAATPGSFWHPDAVTGQPVTIYVHPTGSGNPATNGKVYEATKRHDVLTVGDDAQVRWIRPHAAGNTLGNIVHGRRPVIENCVITGNPLHSINGAGGGYRRRVVAVHEVNLPSDTPLAIEYFTDDGEHLDITFIECVVIGPATMGATNVAGFGGHTTVGKQTFGRVRYIDCSCYNATMDVAQAKGPVEIIRPNIRNGSILISGSYADAVPEVRITDAQMIITALATGATARKNAIATVFSAGKNPKVVVDGLRLYADVPWIAAFNGPANLRLVNSVLAFGSVATGSLALRMISTVQAQYAEISHCIFSAPAGEMLWDVSKAANNGGGFKSDYNVIGQLGSSSGNSVWYRGADSGGVTQTKYSLAEIRATFGTEFHSSDANPGLADPANGDFRYASNGGIPGCGLVRQNIAYTPILTSTAEAIQWLIYGEVR